jgi:hypothetical protein
MKLVALCNICGILQQRDVMPGEPFEARDDTHGKEMRTAGIACLPEEYEGVTKSELGDDQDGSESELGDDQGNNLLAAIQAADTPEALLALMPAEEPVPEIVAAFEARMVELEQ